MSFTLVEGSDRNARSGSRSLVTVRTWVEGGCAANPTPHSSAWTSCSASDRHRRSPRFPKRSGAPDRPGDLARVCLPDLSGLRGPSALWPAAGRSATLATESRCRAAALGDARRDDRAAVRPTYGGPLGEPVPRMVGGEGSAGAQRPRERTRSPTAAHVQPDPPAVVRPAEDATYDGQPQGRAGGRRERLLPALLRAGHARRYGGLSALRDTLSIAPTAPGLPAPAAPLGRPHPCQGVGPQRCLDRTRPPGSHEAGDDTPHRPPGRPTR